MCELKSNEYFNTYVSNTIAGSGNQYIFKSDNQFHKAEIIYKLQFKGKYNYSILFGNTLDTTFGDGTVSHSNDKCFGWTLKNIKLSIVNSTNPSIRTSGENAFINGYAEKVVNEDDILFYTDPVMLDSNENQFLRIEFEYKGSTLPNHQESIISSRLFVNESWIDSKDMPFPLMIGCDRKASKKIGFLGDSITQGIGTEIDSYKHYASITSELLGENYSYWNLGLGYARAFDAATKGIWLKKAMVNDIVTVCLGVNDMFRVNQETIFDNIKSIVITLKNAGCKVIIQTIPPFDYNEKDSIVWENINSRIKKELFPICDGYLDCVSILQKSIDEPNKAKYGGHPNEIGCEIWGKELFNVLENCLK